MEEMIKKGIGCSLLSCFIGLLLWGDYSFIFVGMGVIILGITLLYYINGIYKYKIKKNNKK